LRFQLNWLSTGQPARLLDSGVVYASKDFNDTVHNRRIMWGHASTSPPGPEGTGNCMTLPREVTYDAELGQLLFSPIAEQAELRNGTLTVPGDLVLKPNVPAAE
jgi:sucrose-6-phosphate hydrolase SacC (GH32 family)